MGTAEPSIISRIFFKAKQIPSTAALKKWALVWYDLIPKKTPEAFHPIRELFPHISMVKISSPGNLQELFQ